MGEGEDGGEKATNVHLPVTDQAEDSGRRKIVVMVIASSVKDRLSMLSLSLCRHRGVANLILVIFNAYCLKTDLVFTW